MGASPEAPIGVRPGSDRRPDRRQGRMVVSSTSRAARTSSATGRDDLPSGHHPVEFVAFGGDHRAAEGDLGLERLGLALDRLTRRVDGSVARRPARRGGGRPGPAGPRTRCAPASRTSGGVPPAAARSSIRVRASTTRRRRASAASTRSCSPRVTRPSRRMSGGRVRPWPTRVATMTAKVRKSTRSRSAKEVGRARAAARLMAPAHAGPADDGRLAPRRRRPLIGAEQVAAARAGP